MEQLHWGKKEEIGSILAARWRGKQANTDARMDVAVRQRSHIKWAEKIAILGFETAEC